MRVHNLPASCTIREVGGCVACKYEPDVHRVAAAILATKGGTAETAMESAMSKHYRRHIRTFTPSNASELLRGVRGKYLALSQAGEANGERPLFQ